jgi:hypothetical protein
MSLEIILADGRTAFAPGEEISGKLRWTLEQAPPWVELRLFWYTEGKGTQDVAVAAHTRFSHQDAVGGGSFSLQAPTHPPSCSGRLVSIRWALELVTGDHQPVTKVDLVIAPDAREIILGHVE